MRLSMLWRRKQGVLLCLLITIATVAVIQIYKTHSYTIRTESPWKMSFTDNRQNLVKISPKRDQLSVNKLIEREATPSKFHVNISKECTPLTDQSSIKTPFKFFIYNLPPKFNTDIRVKMSTHKSYAFCYNLYYCGAGEELYQYQGEQLYHNKGRESKLTYNQSYISSVRNSHMFSLEVVIHHKLMHSPYRTLDPSKADIFYIPAYTGLTCLSDYQGANTFVDDLFAYLRANVSYYLSGKPHFSTLGKIQREQASAHCSTLRHRDSANITYITIEKESQTQWFSKTMYGKSVIVAPYPSYIHFIPKLNHTVMKEYKPNISDLINNTHFQLNVPSLAERNVKLLLACSTRRSNQFRAKLIDQFHNQTSNSYEYYFRNKTTDNKGDTHNILLKTPECSSSHRTTTIPWMYHSVFCLQPPGDSPTRKSFYDSILSGCIPVIFSLKHKTEYPFEQWLDYSKFTVALEVKLISKYDQNILDIVGGIPQYKVEKLHENLLGVAQWFQYSMTDGNIQHDNDAVTLILEQLRHMYKL